MKPNPKAAAEQFLTTAFANVTETGGSLAARPAGTIECAECGGLTTVIRNEEAVTCPECEGWGALRDLDYL